MMLQEKRFCLNAREKFLLSWETSCPESCDCHINEEILLETRKVLTKLLEKGSASFFCESTDSILVFAGSKASVATSPLCLCSAKVAIEIMEVMGLAVSK